MILSFVMFWLVGVISTFFLALRVKMVLDLIDALMIMIFPIGIAYYLYCAVANNYQFIGLQFDTMVDRPTKRWRW